MDIVGAYGARYSGKYKNAVAAHQPDFSKLMRAASDVEDIVPIRSPTRRLVYAGFPSASTRETNCKQCLTAAKAELNLNYLFAASREERFD